MKASVFKVAINAILLILISIGCGTGTNLNKLLYVDKEDENRLDHLLSDAQIAYDNGEYQEALNLLEKAEKQSSHSEGVIQLKAFSQLAIGGFDPLRGCLEYSASSLIVWSSSSVGATNIL